MLTTLSTDPRRVQSRLGHTAQRAFCRRLRRVRHGVDVGHQVSDQPLGGIGQHLVDTFQPQLSCSRDVDIVADDELDLVVISVINADDTHHPLDPLPVALLLQEVGVRHRSRRIEPEVDPGRPRRGCRLRRADSCMTELQMLVHDPPGSLGTYWTTVL